KQGTARPSFLASQLEAFKDAPNGKDATKLEDILGAAGAMYTGGADTVIEVSRWGLNVQTKAQEELDRVIGYGRLPELTDRDSLPYLECLLQETLRFI
ncbi:hypothetical protein H0H81_009548, partial [Sphagnurus paluster]